MRFCHLCRAAKFCGSTIIVLYKILEINCCRCRDDVHIVSTVPMPAYKFRCMKKGGQPSENHWLPALVYRRRSVSFFYMFIPPQQWITWPVTYDERSLARNVATLATSSGVPPRRKGICAAHCLRVSSERALVMSVMMNPGAMQLARTPREPSSLAMLFARPIMPAFDAE